MPSPQDVARREFAVADRVLAERRELTILTARISLPTYIRNELGERPSDPAKRQAWDRGVAGIERYRQGARDQGPKQSVWPGEAKGRVEQARQQLARRRLQEVQRVLGREQHAARARQLSRGMGIGR